MVSTVYFHNTQHYNSISLSQKESGSSRRGTVGQGDDYRAKGLGSSTGQKSAPWPIVFTSGGTCGRAQRGEDRYIFAQ